MRSARSASNSDGVVPIDEYNDYGHRHGVIGRTLMETAGEHVAILYNSADGRFVCVMLLATLYIMQRT